MAVPASKIGRRVGALAMASACGIAIASCGHGTNPLAGAMTPASSSTDPAARCRAAVVGAVNQVARRIYAEAQGGSNATSYAHMIERSTSLSEAVARGDAAATRDALMPLLARQLVHVRVTRGASVLADLGRPNALAPSSGVLRDRAGNIVGAYTIAVQDDRAYVQVLHGITGADVVLRASGHEVAGTLPPPHADLPSGGRVRRGDVVYEVESFDGEAFPSGPLRITILVDGTSTSSCVGDSATAAADTLGMAGMRIYEGEVSSGKVSQTISRMQSSARFRRAVARSDRVATLSAINGFFRLHQFHIVRARVFRNGRLLADLGGPDVLGPARAVLLRDPRGRPIASFLVAVQDDAGYMKLAHLFTGAEVVMRVGGRVVMSTLRAPPSAALPRRGTVFVAGRRFGVFGFAGTAFPSGAVDISLLFAAR